MLMFEAKMRKNDPNHLENLQLALDALVLFFTHVNQKLKI